MISYLSDDFTPPDAAAFAPISSRSWGTFDGVVAVLVWGVIAVAGACAVSVMGP